LLRKINFPKFGLIFPGILGFERLRIIVRNPSTPMVSIPGDWVKTNGSTPIDSSLSPNHNDLPIEIDTEQSFRLIDSILPFEACLYHQLLPICLEGSRLKLGMVNPDDSTALDYVRRILAYMNCSLVPQAIPSETHHALLSAYLNHAGKQKQGNRSSEKAQIAAPKVENHPSEPEPPQRAAPSKPPTLDRNTQPTLVVDSPEEISFVDVDVESRVPLAPQNETELPLPTSDEGTIYQEEAQLFPHQEVSAPSTLLLNVEPSVPEASFVDNDPLPVLEVDAQHLSDSVEVLATLSPRSLLQELLGRVLVGGIGRLYFERQQRHGRILWSQNGVLQSVLEQVDLALIQGVINELKLLTHLPLIPVQQARQVEIERVYQKSRLLLRLRVMPGSHGEEATLQVLRGAALKFYQQQQLANLSRDALTIAQQLQNKVNEIRNRTRMDGALTAEQLDVIPTLHQLLKSVDQQLEALRDLQSGNQA
jgi:type II secretory ATPase GspE/PulE/Tfp pilus assembly ATPase PilB-like protein